MQGWTTPRGNLTGMVVEPGAIGMMIESRSDGSMGQATMVVNKPFDQPLRLPAICASCDNTFGTTATVAVDDMDVDAEGPWTCPSCGADATVPDQVVVLDRDGRRYDVRRLDVLRRAVATVIGEKMTAEELLAARDLLERVRRGDISIDDAERSATSGTAKLLGLLRDPAVGVLVTVIIGVLTIMLMLRPVDIADGDIDRIANSVADRIDPILTAPLEEDE